MMGQIALVALTRPVEKTKKPWVKLLGNSFFWIVFTIVGQPFAALWYYFHWTARFGSVSRMDFSSQQATCPSQPITVQPTCST
jgi:diacylglycerol O-acyltransferase 1